MPTAAPLRRHPPASAFRAGLVAAVALLTPIPSAPYADSVVAPCTRDNTLFQDAEGDTSNGSGTGVYCGRNSQGRIRRALLRFDVAGLLPEGAKLDSARLELRMSSSSDLQERVLTLHRVLADYNSNRE